MNHLKTFKKYNEDATANASIGGMGSVISSQPSSLPGDVSGASEGSGDIGVVFDDNGKRKKKRKKGSASEISDLRDLKKGKVNRIKEI